MKLSINLQHLIEFKSTLRLSSGGPELLNLDEGNVSLFYELTSINFDLIDKVFQKNNQYLQIKILSHQFAT